MKKIVLTLFLVTLVAAGCSPNTQGSVNVISSDCKVVTTTTEGSWEALTHSYTCSGASNGQQVCTRIELDSNGNCVKYESYIEGNTLSAQTSAVTPAPVQQIPTNQVQITDLKLTKPSTAGLGYLPIIEYSLKGEVTNNSAYPINNIDLSIEAYDCPGSSITSDCTHIGEATNVGLFVDGFGQIPPNQTREVTDSVVNLNGMPPVKGYFLWSYSVTSIN